MNIIRPNFLTLKGRTFSFNMTDHLDPNQDQDSILTEICKGITEYYQEEFPIWSRLLGGYRIFKITSKHRFFSYLDQESQKADFNCLIFEKHVQGNDITVTHFGPFGKMKKANFSDKMKKTKSALKKLIEKWRILESPDDTKPDEKKKKDRDGIIRELEMKYWRYVQIIELKIDSEKKELNGLIDRIYDDDKETCEDLKRKITTATSLELLIKVTVKEITTKAAAKITAKTGAKVAAKLGAKAGAKTGAKAGAKKIPVVGAVLGLGLGIWRVCHGDVVGAGLEVASGAASCLPGAGTAASLAIDVGIAGRDIIGAKEECKRMEEEMNSMKGEMKRLEADLNDFRVQYGQAKEEYEFVKEVLEDPGFKIEKLEHEISILDDISENVDKS